MRKCVNGNDDTDFIVGQTTCQLPVVQMKECRRMLIKTITINEWWF